MTILKLLILLHNTQCFGKLFLRIGVFNIIFSTPPPFTLFTFTSPTLIVSLVQFNKCSLSLVPFIFPNFGFLQTKIVLPSSNCLSEGSLQKLGNGDFCKPQNSTFEIDSCKRSSNCNFLVDFLILKINPTFFYTYTFQSYLEKFDF